MCRPESVSLPEGGVGYEDILKSNDFVILNFSFLSVARSDIRPTSIPMNGISMTDRYRACIMTNNIFYN
jgi:hypothetical protein